MTRTRSSVGLRFFFFFLRFLTSVIFFGRFFDACERDCELSFRKVTHAAARLTSLVPGALIGASGETSCAFMKVA